ncbi:hypothetical protein B0H94_107212 [Salsuginibacillus halophilus]|uniref:Uncharacterized protein n=1 Tax=Salsuginibacillus halophilus TaxID=517424 RepID=A0A2P8HG57_9BACI|nr:sporulation protein YhbH [Salsuginibacillus halophilus]PSL45207.1 hypothetical protein B0H94_107212 [Salsuginibacillus halophilus]
MKERDVSKPIISEENWSLHRKGEQDQHRHEELVKEAIREQLPDIITEESIIMSDGRGKVRIPIRSLDEYKIRYNEKNNPQVGQGDGDSDVGDVIGREAKKGQQGAGEGAGDGPGEDIYETDISLAELEEVMFQELELPNLKKKEKDSFVVDDIEFNDIRKQGLMGNVDKRRTILSALKRNAMKGKNVIHPIYQEDLRFKTWNETKLPESKAVILAMMDTSGSMGRFEKYVARSFFFWMVRFLRTKYTSVDIEFIAHHTEAKVVTEEEFFGKGESGGTVCSSAYRKALALIDADYSPERYNIYPFHVSDGDNLTSDQARCTALVRELLEVSSMFGYTEINPQNRPSTLMSAFRPLHDPAFRKFVIREKADVMEALKTFFHEEETNVV